MHCQSDMASWLCFIGFTFSHMARPLRVALRYFGGAASSHDSVHTFHSLLFCVWLQEFSENGRSSSYQIPVCEIVRRLTCQAQVVTIKLKQSQSLSRAEKSGGGRSLVHHTLRPACVQGAHFKVCIVDRLRAFRETPRTGAMTAQKLTLTPTEINFRSLPGPGHWHF